MEIVKIVFTGGPCAGKTKLIERIKEYLLENNYDVIVVPETATIILDIGLNFKFMGNVIDFQKTILKMQDFNEKLVEENIKSRNKKKIVLLYDRGILDNKAYCESYENLDLIMNFQGLSEIDCLDNYNLVFDLITTADCAPEKYTLATNKQRTESIEEAKILDKKTSNAWSGHRNLKIINSNISIDEAFELLKNEINNKLEKATKKEIKKFYIENTLEDFSNYDDNNSRLINIEELKLNIKNYNKKYVLYKRTYKGKNSYIFKVFKEEKGIETTYYDEKISEKKYLELISKYKVKEINSYKQLTIIENRQAFDIKFYNEYSTLEYEENKLNEELILPENVRLKNKINSNKRLLKNKKHVNII